MFPPQHDARTFGFQGVLLIDINAWTFSPLSNVLWYISMRHNGHSLCMAAVSFDRISGATVTPSEVWSFDREQCDKTLTSSRRWVQAGQISPSWFLLVGSSRGNRVMCLMHKRINSVGNYSEATAIGRMPVPEIQVRSECRCPNICRPRGEFLPFCRRHLS